MGDYFLNAAVFNTTIRSAIGTVEKRCEIKTVIAPASEAVRRGRELSVRSRPPMSPFVDDLSGPLLDFSGAGEVPAFFRKGASKSTGNE
jgi:hypothetical protein